MPCRKSLLLHYPWNPSMGIVLDQDLTQDHWAFSLSSLFLAFWGNSWEDIYPSVFLILSTFYPLADHESINEPCPFQRMLLYTPVWCSFWTFFLVKWWLLLDHWAESELLNHLTLNGQSFRAQGSCVDRYPVVFIWTLKALVHQVLSFWRHAWEIRMLCKKHMLFCAKPVLLSLHYQIHKVSLDQD